MGVPHRQRRWRVRRRTPPHRSYNQRLQPPPPPLPLGALRFAPAGHEEYDPTLLPCPKGLFVPINTIHKVQLKRYMYLKAETGTTGAIESLSL